MFMKLLWDLATRNPAPTPLPLLPLLRGRNHGLHERMIYRMNYHSPPGWWQTCTGWFWLLYLKGVQAGCSMPLYLTACQVSISNKGTSFTWEITISSPHCQALMSAEEVHSLYLTQKAFDWQQTVRAKIYWALTLYQDRGKVLFYYALCPLIFKTTQWGMYCYNICITDKKNEL